MSKMLRISSQIRERKSSVRACRARRAWLAHLDARCSWRTQGHCPGLLALAALADPPHGRGSRADTAQHILQIRRPECLRSHSRHGGRTDRTQDSQELPESEDCCVPSTQQETWCRVRAGRASGELQPSVRRHLHAGMCSPHKHLVNAFGARAHPKCIPGLLAGLPHRHLGSLSLSSI